MVTMEEEQIIAEIAKHYESIISLLGDNPGRPGLEKTPMRAAKALYYATQGYRQDAAATIKSAIFDYAGSRMVIVKDIEFYSFCEHHILPFFGKVSIGYIPDGEMVGLSKLARAVNVYARRLQVQERLTAEICDTVASSLKNKGVIVVCNAQHLCMKMRGVEKQESSTSSIEYTGEFASNPALREEFFRMLSDVK
ncbi:MAG: GTP cyclohydrolase I FolE [Muribaculum sp.]|nr:GTP cyclohydrolase I FolE [Muribaculum sp.]